MRLLLTIMAIAVFSNTAIAHSPEQMSQMGDFKKKWLQDLKNKNGDLCCNGDDGFDAQYDTQDGHYRVFLHNRWWVVPDNKIINEPNLIGVAQVWYVTYWNLDKTPRVEIRCFIPGAGG